MDYAAKQWAGLVKDYYTPRWGMFFDTIQENLQNGEAFDEKTFRKEFIEKLGKPFTMDKKLYPVETIGDSVAVALSLYKKWRIFL